MVALTVKNFTKKILVVGSFYDKIEILQTYQNLWDQHDLIIFNGNLCYPNDNLELVERRIEKMDNLLQTGKFIYNLGNQDLMLMKRLSDNSKYTAIINWLKNKSNVIIIDFLNQSSLIITNGGVTPEMKRTDLYNNIETSFVSFVDNKSWHQQYGGNYGYIISNNPLTHDPPKLYNFSIQLGNIYSDKSQIYAVQIEQHGIGQIFSLQY